MEKLVIHPTCTAEWHALVNEAQALCSYQLDEALESYLVFLLMRFTSQSDLAKGALALDFLAGLQSTSALRHDALQQVGDKCLLFAGLFPGRAERLRVRISYFVGLGQSAYSTLSLNPSGSVGELFAALCEEFVRMMEVLHASRELTGQVTLTPQQAFDLWESTGSEKALERAMSEAEDGSIVITPESNQKH